MRKALLLIHGFLTCTDDWNVLLPHLSPLYDSTVLFTQPGHVCAGEKPHYRDFCADACFEALDKTLDTLKEFDCVDVVGHSMGGGMAFYAASRLPNVRRLLSYAPAFRYPRPGALMRQSAQLREHKAFAASLEDRRLAEKLTDDEQTARKMFSESVELFFKRLLPHWSPRNIINFMRIMSRARGCIKQVRCPMCVMYGELDEFLPLVSTKETLENADSREIYFIRYGLKGHALIYLGDCRDVIADSLAFLKGGNPLERTPGKTELRAAYRIARGEATDKIVTVGFDEQVFRKGRRDPTVRRKRITETYSDGGDGFFKYLDRFDFIK